MTELRTGFLPAPGLPTAEAFELAEDVGLDYVELFAEGDEWRERFLSDQEQVRQKATEHGLGLTAHLPFPVDLGAPYEGVRAAALDAVESYLGPLSEMGVEKAVLHLDETITHTTDQSVDAALDTLLSVAPVAAERGETYGIEICVENLPDATFDTDALARLLTETDVSATLDTGHAVIDGWTESEAAALIRDHPEQISHVHCNDNRVTADDWRSSDEHLPLGAGTVDFETLFAPATEGVWSPTFTMEIVTWDAEYVRTSTQRLHAILGRD